LVVKVAPLTLDLLVFPSALDDSPPPPLASLLATGYTLLRFVQSLLRFAMVPRVFDSLSLSGDEKDLQPHIDAGFFAGKRERLYGHLGARDAGVPSIRFPRDGDGLGRACQWTMDAHRNPANLGETEDATVQHGAALLAHLRIGEAIVPLLAL